MAKLIKKDGRLFIELPESLQDKKIKAIKLEPEIFVIASEDAIKRLIDRQLRYVITRRVKNRLVQRGEKKGEEKKTVWNEDYAIIKSDEAARAFSREHAWEFKRGELLGVKGFDGKYYVVRASLYSEVLSKIEYELGKESLNSKELAERLKLPEELVKAVVEIAKEDGIIYEDRGGKYHYAG